MWTMPSGGVVRQRPRVKSGTRHRLGLLGDRPHAQIDDGAERRGVVHRHVERQRPRAGT